VKTRANRVLAAVTVASWSLILAAGGVAAARLRRYVRG
jgi:hypothetical protein